MKILSITMVAAIAVTAAAQANAQPAPIVVESDVPSAVVSYADLNISSTAGRHTLEGRASRAAESLCLGNRSRPIDQALAERHCYSVAMAQARIDIDLAVARARAQLASGSTIRIAAR